MNIEINNDIKTNGCFTDFLNEDDNLKLRNIYNKFSNDEFKNACHTNYKDGYTYNTSFEELSDIKEKVLEYQAEYLNVMQYWYFNSDTKFSNEDIFNLNQIISKIIKDAYPDDVLKLYDTPNHISYTMFDKGCYIQYHSDGASGLRLCNVLFYLNDDYLPGYGGELVINDNIVIRPQFGRYAIIDFYYVNPPHKVNPIIVDNFQRKAFVVSIPILQSNN